MNFAASPRVLSTKREVNVTIGEGCCGGPLLGSLMGRPLDEVDWTGQSHCMPLKSISSASSSTLLTVC